MTLLKNKQLPAMLVGLTLLINLVFMLVQAIITFFSCHQGFWGDVVHAGADILHAGAAFVLIVVIGVVLTPPSRPRKELACAAAPVAFRLYDWFYWRPNDWGDIAINIVIALLVGFSVLTIIVQQRSGPQS